MEVTAPTATVSNQAEGLWWRDRWSEYIWQSDLPGIAKCVALCYADHARSGRTAWLTNARAVQRTSFSKRSIQDARQRLIDDGWLIEVQPARGNYVAVYALVLPDGVLPPVEPTTAPEGCPVEFEPQDAPGAPDETDEEIAALIAEALATPVSEMPAPRWEHPTLTREDARRDAVANREEEAWEEGVRHLRGGGATGAPNHTTNPTTYSSSSPKYRASASRMMKIDINNSLLDHLPIVFERHNVRNPEAWLATVCANGDLLMRLTEAAEEVEARRPQPVVRWECDDHGSVVGGSCRQCVADIKAGDRRPDQMGMRL